MPTKKSLAPSSKTATNIPSSMTGSTKTRTSTSHPLRIGDLAAGTRGGLIGVTFCPGKKGPSNSGFVWDRDLELDLDVIKDWNPAAIVTLIEDAEFEELGVPDLGLRIVERGIEWHHLPIQDVQPPDGRFETGWKVSGPKLLALLRAGKRILVHCRGGLGRAGTVAARLLVELETPPKDAVAKVRQARPGAIETRDQLNYVLALRQPSSAAQLPSAPPAPRRDSSKSLMDWFERITGFREISYESTRAKLSIENDTLISTNSEHRFGVGRLELVSLRELRDRARTAVLPPGRLTVKNLVGDVRAMHSQSEMQGALFQVASQFNLLEMVGPQVTPEQGVTRYAHDHTQGPACAIAAGAATIFRNYFAPVGGQTGQTEDRQIDALAKIGQALSSALDRPVPDLWTMRNGYALCTADGLTAIDSYIGSLTDDSLDALRAELCIGIHWNVQVTDTPAQPPLTVSQAFCSALPVAYSRLNRALWGRFARLVLEAAYEATLLAGLINQSIGGSPAVLLTQLGGGAFGNDDTWINDAMARAFALMARTPIAVNIVNYHSPSESMLAFESIASPHAGTAFAEKLACGSERASSSDLCGTALS